MALSIECLKLGIYDTNCYLIAPSADGAPVLVIDPAADGEAILSALHGRRVAAVLLTHGHFDHTGALSAFQGVPVYMHADDAPCLADPHLSAGDTVGDLTSRTGDLHFVQEGDTLRFDGFDLPVRVMHTPGHTRGSVVYCLGNDWFTGDTLFRHGYGRTDMPGGNWHQMMSSMRRLLKSPQDAAIYPGHGDSSTLFHERGRT